VPQLQRFSTDDQPPSRRIDYWNDVTGSALTAQIARPVDRPSFCGRMTRLDIGDVRLVELNASGSTVTPARASIGRASQPMYLVRLALSGDIKMEQAGRTAYLRPGDFTLCDTSRPYQTSFREPSDVLIIRIPHARLRQYIKQPEVALSITMPGNAGLSGLASRHVRELWNASQEFIAHDASPRLMEVTLQLLASAYSLIPQAKADRSSVASTLRAQIVEIIEQSLDDPQLSPSRIAARLRISPGYLHRVFSGDDDTAARYILRRRLEECARGLADPAQARRTITTIAFAMGFNSLSHFSRVFRNRYGTSPAEYRHATVPFFGTTTL
jgi:AraC-like DNA-binding protein